MSYRVESKFMEGTLFLQTTLVHGKEAKRAQGLPRGGREGEWGALIGRAPGEMVEWGALIGRAPGEMVGLAALLLGDLGVRPSEKARFWAGEREFGAKRKKGRSSARLK